jgi:hypothetical protein
VVITTDPEYRMFIDLKYDDEDGWCSSGSHN